jgi:hypothetical protein
VIRNQGAYHIAHVERPTSVTYTSSGRLSVARARPAPFASFQRANVDPLNYRRSHARRERPAGLDHGRTCT